jgi:predicted RNA binding protein YcfA (HicA-like mRNA interferase family)
VKVADAIKMVEASGWYLHSQRGSHRQFKHPTKRGRVTIAGQRSKELAPPTLNSIMRQAGLK